MIEMAILEIVDSLEERSVAVAHVSLLKLAQKNFAIDLDGSEIQSLTMHQR